jgi:hypothetical protein
MSNRYENINYIPPGPPGHGGNYASNTFDASAAQTGGQGPSATPARAQTPTAVAPNVMKATGFSPGRSHSPIHNEPAMGDAAADNQEDDREADPDYVPHEAQDEDEVDE